jgi:hypothetical protein
VGLKLDRPVGFAGNTDAPTSSTLTGRWLVLARLGWLAVFALTIGMLLASLPAYYDWLINFADPELEPAAIRANLKAAGISVDFYATYLLSIGTASAMVWVAVGVVIFWRRSDDWMALFTSLSLITFGAVSLNEGPAALADQYSVLWLPVHLVALFGTVSLNLFYYLFPNGYFVPRWTRWAAILFAAHEVAYYLFPDSIFNIARSLFLLDFAVLATFAVIAIGSQLYRYRYVSAPVERQKTKWVVFGTVLAALGVVAFELPVPGSPFAQLGSSNALAIQAGLYGSLLLIPLSIGVAIIHDRLWDIDIVINRALVYGVLTTALALVYFGGVAATEAVFRAFTGQEEQPQLAIVGSTLVIAALFSPLRRRIQAFIDRSFYRRKYDAAKTLEAFSAKMRTETDLDALSDDLVGAVRETMQPAHVSLWLRPDPGSGAQHTPHPGGERIPHRARGAARYQVAGTGRGTDGRLDPDAEGQAD